MRTLVCLLWFALVGAGYRAGAAERPRLVVVISIDQCRADYMERFRPWFGEGGFARFFAEGTVFTDCRHRHAQTVTAAGHATIGTGVHAEVHGIIGNEWYDREGLLQTTSVHDPEAALLGVLPARPGKSPRRLAAATVGDELKRRLGDGARVVGVTIKDRAAIMMAGRGADAVYWLERGSFVSSDYYMERLPDWVDRFNSERRVEAVFGSTWDRLLDASVYDRVQGLDDAPGEESRHGLGTTFPRKLDGGEARIGTQFYDAYRLAPHSSTLLTAFALETIARERLGTPGRTDLLCIGYSQTDYAGHSYGPDSHEIMDSMLRLDRDLAQLFAGLDAAVGVGRYTVAVTADHGVAPLPERSTADRAGEAGRRFDGDALVARASEALTARFGAPDEGDHWLVRDGSGLRLRASALEARGADRSHAASLVRDAISGDPQLAAVFTAEELRRRDAHEPGESLRARVRRGYHPDRSPDVLYVLAPFVVDRRPAGTNHGSPYEYDAHVPLLWFGPGVPRGETVTRRVGVDAIAPTVAALLGVPPPPETVASPLF
jgi:predicted AlkP superfamily pyrophosphatase or phosphodiesterase